MSRIRILREARRLSVEDLAEMVDVPPQHINDVEEGVVEPSQTLWRDLAVAFGTSVLHLSGKHPFSDDVVSTAMMTKEFDDFTEFGFWGHIGIKLKGVSVTHWYPISVEAYQEITECLEADDSRSELWIAAETLNNRALVFDALKIERITFVDEAAEMPSSYRDAPFHVSNYYPAEVFKGAVEISLAEGDFPEGMSVSFHQLATKFMEKWEISDLLDLHDAMTATNTHMVDGTTRTETLCNSGCLAVFEAAIGNLCSNVPRMISFSDFGGDCDWYVPSREIVMLDMPLSEIVDEACRD
ncbi:helix-turn-helix domain-containing protein [Thalassospira xianhensis]|uniref:HTH cro/C1-type domain-containing protein n=1 Tax=Thalassospira xianhensis MCCC 1A02616 TaxID=1177929 RepID=A0A367UEC7_9PROT|nr:helix-turn-helix transcriptional regulator [Thalassospira xianhensis]RCK06330.1 hypothetical protein TH5_09010 [Thalassospira xianhensis MCCC 1A02616]